MSIRVDELLVGDAPQDWARAGFDVRDDVCVVGDVRLRLQGTEKGRGLRGWSLGGLAAATEVDGIPTTLSPAAPSAGGTHPNGVTGIDHVVLLSPDLTRTKAALAGLGLDPRRERDGELGGAPIRQIFYRPGGTILELIGSPDDAGSGPASLWGLTFTVGDLDAAVAFLGAGAGRIKDAVQPGRRITTLRHRELGLSVRIALISPHVRSGSDD